MGSRVELLRRRADAGECDLVAKARTSGDEVGFLYVGSGRFESDRRGERIGVDRDGDGFRDGDERDAQTDPADPAHGRISA